MQENKKIFEKSIFFILKYLKFIIFFIIIFCLILFFRDFFLIKFGEKIFYLILTIYCISFLIYIFLIIIELKISNIILEENEIIAIKTWLLRQENIKIFYNEIEEIEIKRKWILSKYNNQWDITIKTKDKIIIEKNIKNIKNLIENIKKYKNQ